MAKKSHAQNAEYLPKNFLLMSLTIRRPKDLGLLAQLGTAAMNVTTNTQRMRGKMSQQFKTPGEIIKHLADGGAVKAAGYSKAIYLDENGQFNDDATIVFNSPEVWSKAEKSKPKKILKPFLLKYIRAGAVECLFFKSEEIAKEYAFKCSIKYLGPAKGIPDQEVEEI